MANNIPSSENEKLSDIFDSLWKKYTYLDTTDDPCCSDKYQDTVKQAVETCEKLIEIVNDLHLFSDNENFDEIATNEIRFLLLPALLAYFTNKNMKEDRYEIVKKCQLYHIDFLKLCKNYSVTDITIPDIKGTDEKSSSNSSSQKALEDKRKLKIKRFKEQKETEERLQELYPLVQKEHVDDDVKREYYTKLLKQWINTSLEDLDSIESELPILEHMAKLKKSGKQKEQTSQSKTQPTRKPMRPFIITKDQLQKQVFGLGYPGVPTYTLEEFYQRQVEKGELPDQGHKTLQNSSNDPDAERKEQEKKEREKEEQIERDDKETLQKAREWDDWKDDHRRGWGNTDNKG